MNRDFYTLNVCYPCYPEIILNDMFILHLMINLSCFLRSCKYGMRLKKLFENIQGNLYPIVLYFYCLKFKRKCKRKKRQVDKTDGLD